MMIMEAVSAPETSVGLNETTRRRIPESCHVRTRRRENLKSHQQLQITPCRGLFSSRRDSRTLNGNIKEAE
jgi:hypothetical protein